MKNRIITIPTLVTFARIALTPVIVISMIMQAWGYAFLFFIVAALTDVIDGFLARWFDDRTILGACLDPIADKFLLISCFFTLGFVQSPLFSIPHWFVYCVLIKEMILICGVATLYLFFGPIEIRPTRLGKLTTLAQIAFIMWLFACYFFHWVPVKTYYTMLGLLMTVLVASLTQYAYNAFRILGIKFFGLRLLV